MEIRDILPLMFHALHKELSHHICPLSPSWRRSSYCIALCNLPYVFCPAFFLIHLENIIECLLCTRHHTKTDVRKIGNLCPLLLRVYGLVSSGGDSVLLSVGMVITRC